MFDPAKTRILVVDDYQSMREMMKTALEELGFKNVLQAEDGEVALRAIINIQPPVTLILCDWNMPKVTGLEFLKKVRSDTRCLQFAIS